MGTADEGARRGLFLDMDGTAADSLAVMRIVYRRFLAEHDREGSEEEFDRVNGVPLRAVVLDLQQRHGLPGEPRDHFRRFVELLGSTYEEVPPMPGLRELVRGARERDMAVALVTSAVESFARTWLERTELAPLFDAVVGGDAVERGKPHPDPYLRAIEVTGAEAAGSVAVEDSLAGARSAVAAGLATFVIGAAEPRALDWPPVSGFVRALSDVPLEVGRVRG